MGIGTTYIELGSRWQNGHVESFHNHFGDECLNQQLFLSVTEAQVVIEEWRFFLQPGSFASRLCFQSPEGYARGRHVRDCTALGLPLRFEQSRSL